MTRPDGKNTAEQRRASGGVLELSVAQTEWTPAQRAALRQLNLEDASDADLMVFLHQAQRTGLDPFSRQIYMIARWDSASGKEKYTIQAGIDGLRVIASRNPHYGGQTSPQWAGKDGVWRDLWIGGVPPVAARIGVIHAGWRDPVWGVAMFAEYAGRKKGGELASMWATKPALMVAKCAEALALRKAFPHDLAGLYTDDEMAAPHERTPWVAAIEPVTSAEIRGEPAIAARDPFAAIAETVDLEALQEMGRQMAAAGPLTPAPAAKPRPRMVWA